MNKLTPNQRIVAKEVIPFMTLYNHISPKDLDDILETLKDNGFLSEKGKDFKTALWNLFIFEGKKLDNKDYF